MGADRPRRRNPLARARRRHQRRGTDRGKTIRRKPAVAGEMAAKPAVGSPPTRYSFHHFRSQGDSMRNLLRVVAALIVAAPALAVDIHDTRLLTQPAISGARVAFSYANDLWVAKLDGSDVRRLTSHPGIEGNPRFSPDGKWIAFSGEYDGNVDVFVVPSEGGVPRRLTWHPGPDIPLGFTPDGSAVLFTSPREVYTARYTQLFTVPVTGGMATKLPIPNAAEGTYAPDGSHLVYQPIGDAFVEWKHYRGGQNSRLMLFDTKSYAVEQIPQPKKRSTDQEPSWMGDKVYFLSDRNGEFNLFSFDPKSKDVKQLPHFTA